MSGGEADPRLAELLGSEVGPEAPPRVVLVGFPSDEGVRINGGRPGAAAGPGAIRERLRGLTPDPEAGDRMHRLLAHTEDLGDVRVSGDVAADQERLAEALGPHLAAGAVAVVLGGGHETTYGHYLGHVRAGAEPAPEILNWDAHPDVRPLADGRPHSGSPFRQALLHDERPARRYRVAGLLPQSTARAHLDFVAGHGGDVVWSAELDAETVERLYDQLEPPALVSFDLDAVDQAHAPGVSAPATGGLTARSWLAAAYLAGRSPAVASVDVVELNPRFDRDGQTARLAALTVWRVLAGLADRWEEEPWT